MGSYWRYIGSDYYVGGNVVVLETVDRQPEVAQNMVVRAVWCNVDLFPLGVKSTFEEFEVSPECLREARVDELQLARIAIEGTVKVKAYCGRYVGSPKWQYGSDWVYEPDECGTEFFAIVNEEEFKDGCASAMCPNCHQELYQSDDHFELVKDESVLETA